MMKYKFKHHAILEQGEFPTLEQYPEFSEDEEFVEKSQRLLRNEDILEAGDEFDPDSFDTYINMEV